MGTDFIPKGARFTCGRALPWTEAEAEVVLRTRLRIVGRPQPPNEYGLVGIGFHLVVLPTTPGEKETPIATIACILNLN